VNGEWNYIVAAYAVTWVVILGYGGYALRRVAEARRALARTEEGVR
jgi:hypothetical protein